MTVRPETIVAIDHDLARIAVPETRIQPVTLEVEQLASAIERARSRLDFDSEPADFRAVLTETAGSGSHG